MFVGRVVVVLAVDGEAVEGTNMCNQYQNQRFTMFYYVLFRFILFIYFGLFYVELSNCSSSFFSSFFLLFLSSRDPKGKFLFMHLI